MLFAIGAGDQVIAVDDQSNYPPEALQKPHDLSGYEPNVEAIAKLKPDLVAIGGDFTGLTDQLKAVGIEVWNGPAAVSVDDVYAQIEQLGAMTGHVADAAELVSTIKSGLDAAVKQVPPASRPLTYYHELDSTYFSVTSTSFLGQIYSLFGLRSIADLADADNPYPQLSAEAIVSAEPDLIFLADTKCCQQDAATVAARDGWSAIPAVAAGNVFPMDDDIASRWGPRIVDYAEAVAAALSKAKIAVG
jgi:iron complex transport system substrate-binding protein